MKPADLQTLPDRHTDFIFAVYPSWEALLAGGLLLSLAAWLVWQWVRRRRRHRERT